MVFVALKLAAVANKRCFGRQSQHFGLLGHPVVVHPLGIFGVAHQSRDIQATVNFKFIANNAYNRYPLARPLAFFKDFVPVDLAVFDSRPVRLTRLLGLAVNGPQLLVFGRSFKRRGVSRVQIERALVVIDVIVVGNADRVLIEPLGQVLVAYAQRLQRRNRR